jgi:RHS repeat-associated protein
VIDKDAAGHVTQQVLFTYDALNERIVKEVKQGGTDVATDFILDRGNPLLDFVDDDGPAGLHAPALAMRYLTGPAVDQVFAQEDASGRDWWLLTDNLRSVRDLVDNSGTIVNHITYDSYGNVIAQTHPTVTTRFLFAGREIDAETGLYFDRARYYDPKLGRFLSEDPIRFRGGANLYRYVHNTPVSRIDPLGTQDDNPDGEPAPSEDQPAPQSDGEPAPQDDNPDGEPAEDQPDQQSPDDHGWATPESLPPVGDLITQEAEQGIALAFAQALVQGPGLNLNLPADYGQPNPLGPQVLPDTAPAETPLDQAKQLCGEHCDTAASIATSIFQWIILRNATDPLGGPGIDPQDPFAPRDTGTGK